MEISKATKVAIQRQYGHVPGITDDPLVKPAPPVAISAGTLAAVRRLHGDVPGLVATPAPTKALSFDLPEGIKGSPEIILTGDDRERAVNAMVSKITLSLEKQFTQDGDVTKFLKRLDDSHDLRPVLYKNVLDRVEARTTRGAICDAIVAVLTLLWKDAPSSHAEQTAAIFEKLKAE